MIVNANISRDVFEYYKGYDLSQVVNALLEMYDFTNLPQCAPKTDPGQRKECKINVSNEYYISLYNTLGARSKKLSLGRLLEFGCNMDILSHSRFHTMRVEQRQDNPVHSLLDRAYRALLMAQKYDDSVELEALTNLVYKYMEGCRH